MPVCHGFKILLSIRLFVILLLSPFLSLSLILLGEARIYSGVCVCVCYLETAVLMLCSHWWSSIQA